MRHTWWSLCAAMAVAGLAAAAGQTPADTERGEQIQNASCASCHDLRPIQTAAYDSEGWTRIVSSMIEKGAEVKKDDIPALVGYLAASHGPVPEGAGKEILLNICTICHDLQRIRRTSATREEWEGTLEAMLNEGAPLSEQDFPVILNYLARNFRPR